MEDVCGEPEIPRLAANRLGQWQATAALPDVSWLTTDQLSQRVSVTELDWSAVDADSRAVALWQARWQLLDQLSAVPRVLSHGDFGTGNIIRAGDDTVVLDWGTVGKAAVGSDLAYLGLGTLDDFTADYLASLAGRYPQREAVLGYRATLCLVGTSRLHWMLMAGRGIPPDISILSGTTALFCKRSFSARNAVPPHRGPPHNRSTGTPNWKSGWTGRCKGPPGPRLRRGRCR